ncbi:MAG: ribonuclease HI [Treponema sp.]|jgi:ribonuclease HI|nr:ribonuclease HI [Treponema sp.]
MINIYTDGGCSGNPGPGGWAYIIEGDGRIISEKWGAERDTTNNRMELSAVIAALEALSALNPCGQQITIYTDSQYVQKGISEWIYLWKKNGWRNSNKEPVKNKDLWQHLELLDEEFSPSWRWVRGHAGNFMNERCDRMTRCAIESLWT